MEILNTIEEYNARFGFESGNSLVDVVDFKEGEIRTFPSYLTTSIKNWNQPNHQLIITPNLSHTNAKALYKIRNDKEEYQVNFKRGTSFLIEKVEPFEEDGIEFKRIWMKEL